MIEYYRALKISQCHPSVGWDPGQNGLQRQEFFRQDNKFFYFCSVVPIFRNIISLTWVPAFRLRQGFDGHVAGITRWALLFSLSSYPMTNDMWHEICRHEASGEKELAIVVPTYNNSRWCIKNITSILSQRYDNYHVYIIDDCSTDDTYQKLYEFLSNHPLNYKVTLYKNNSRRLPMANWYAKISELEDHVIVLNVDGDDWLANEYVFARINNAYADMRIWMTFGQFRRAPGGQKGFCKRHAPTVIIDNSYRRTEWLSSHLRTYYAWLFKKIKKEDLQYQGEFLPASCDRAIMYPLLEMCAGHYTCFEDEILYIYNVQNPLAYVKKALKVQQKMGAYVRGLPPYKPLAEMLVKL